MSRRPRVEPFAWVRDERDLEPGPHRARCRTCGRVVEIKAPIPIRIGHVGGGVPAIIGRCPTCHVELIKFVGRS